MNKSVVIKVKGANTGKLEQVDKSIDRWSICVNKAIDTFWSFSKADIHTLTVPDSTQGDCFTITAHEKAWQVVKQVKNRVHTLCERLQELDFYSKEAKKLSDNWLELELDSTVPIYVTNDKVTTVDKLQKCHRSPSKK